jgi:hypothetical protein
MPCERDRVSAHLLGQDPGCAEHLSSCAACAAEAESLRGTLALLGRYGDAWSERRRRASPLPAAIAAAVLAAVTFWILSLASGGGRASHLAARNGDWVFAAGEPAGRIATLPGTALAIGAVRIEGGSRARVDAGRVRLEDGSATLDQGGLDAGRWRIESDGDATVHREAGELRVEARRGVVVARREGREERLQAPADVVLEPGDVEARPPIVLVHVPFAVRPGRDAAEEFAAHLAGADPALRRQAVRMAVLLELRPMLPALRRAAADDADPRLREAALYAVWRLDPDRAFLRERALRDTDERTRGAAYRYLGGTATAEDVGVLVEALDAPYRSEALLALTYMAGRGLAMPPDLDARVEAMRRESSGRTRHACLRYLLERKRVSVGQARAILFDPRESALDRRMAATRLLAADRDAAAVDFRALFESEGAESRLIAIDLLCLYGTMEDARRVSGLLTSGTAAERGRVFTALGLKANRDLRPPVPLRPLPAQEDEVARRLLEWVNR